MGDSQHPIDVANGLTRYQQLMTRVMHLVIAPPKGDQGMFSTDPQKRQDAWVRGGFYRDPAHILDARVRLEARLDPGARYALNQLWQTMRPQAREALVNAHWTAARKWIGDPRDHNFPKTEAYEEGKIFPVGVDPPDSPFPQAYRPAGE
jgi:hypothetical protein